MRERLFAVIGIVALLAAVMVGVIQAHPGAGDLPTGTYNLTGGEYIFDGDCVADEQAYNVDPLHWHVVCDVAAPDPTATNTPVPPTATATSEPTATSTPVPPTSTPTAFNNHWHGPQAHDGLNIHEHGHAPPAWVLSSGFVPSFPSGPEAHQGFKAFHASEKNGHGDESYFLGHIISTDAAHNVACHSYKLWILDESGGVSYAAGVMCFDDNGDGVPDLVTSEAARPPGGHILSDNDGGCESWYTGAGAFDADGWTICGRHSNFAGQNIGGTGTFRTFEWILYSHHLESADWVQLSPTLVIHPDQYGASTRFRVDSVEFDPSGIVEQVN